MRSRDDARRNQCRNEPSSIIFMRRSENRWSLIVAAVDDEGVAEGVAPSLNSQWHALSIPVRAYTLLDAHIEFASAWNCMLTGRVSSI